MIAVKIRELIREIVLGIQHAVYTKIFKMDIDKNAKISFSARLDKTNPKGIHIGEESYIAGGNSVYS